MFLPDLCNRCLLFVKLRSKSPIGFSDFPTPNSFATSVYALCLGNTAGGTFICPLYDVGPDTILYFPSSVRIPTNCLPNRFLLSHSACTISFARMGVGTPLPRPLPPLPLESSFTVVTIPRKGYQSPPPVSLAFSPFPTSHHSTVRTTWLYLPGILRRLRHPTPAMRHSL